MSDTKIKPMKARTSPSALAIGLALGLVVASMPHLALASSASAGGGLPYEGFLTNIQKSVSGPLAYTIALGGVGVGGATLIFGGDMNGFVRTLILLVCASALLISAPALLTAISGAGAVVAAGALAHLA